MQVILHKKEQFKEALAHYKPSVESLSILNDVQLLILQGITSSGRNTIIDKLVELGEYQQIVSDTTRPPKVRDGAMEQNGVQYYFRSEDEVLADILAGKYLEAELIHDQQVSGISIRELQRVNDSNKISVNEVAREGVENIRALKPDTIFVFVIPPNYDEWMKRLTARETMTPEELRNRTESAVLEIREALSKPYFHFVVNDELSTAVRDVDEIAQQKVEPEAGEEDRAVAEQLLASIEQHLSTH